MIVGTRRLSGEVVSVAKNVVTMNADIVEGRIPRDSNGCVAQ